MLERNRPASPLPSVPSRSGDWFDGQGAGGLFASAEDYDATGILAGVDPCESRYWWIPDLFASKTAAAAQPVVDGLPLVGSGTATSATESLAERLRRNGQATRRNGSRSTAAA
jgi:hypothetical protein